MVMLIANDDDNGNDNDNDNDASSRVLRNGARARDSRFLSLFTVVRFPNSMCLTSSNSNGTCYTQKVR